jgi:hypothetical protein
MKNLLTIVLLLCCSIGTAQEAITSLLEKVERLQRENEEKIQSALVVAEAVKKAGALINSLADLSLNGEVSLPVGIIKGDYMLVVQQIAYDEKTSQPYIYASCAFKFKDSGQPVAFEGRVPLNGQNGLGASGELSLIAPVIRKIGNTSAIIIRSGTSLHFGCEGVESFDAKMTWLITSGNIIPVDKAGNPENTPIAVEFDATFRNFDTFLVSLDINKSFTLKGLDDIIFTLKGATLDQSDLETSPMSTFPDNYFAGNDERQLWKGLSITEASVNLPAIFKRPDSSGRRIEIALQQALFDENGFSGNIAVKDIINSNHINREQWDISLTDFSLVMLRNQLAGFGFGGDINIPPLGKNSLLPYTASFNPALEKYEFKVGIAGTYDFPVLSSSITLNELSTIDLLIKGGDFYPTINASGTLTINTPLNSDSSKTFSIPDISFENMLISREAPYFKIGKIGVSGTLRTPSIAGFQMSINEIRSIDTPEGSGLAFDAGVSLSDMFGGEADMELYGDYTKWKFKKLNVNKIRVNFQSGAFSINGDVYFKNGDEIYGDGFRGDITLKLIDKFELQAIGVFGKVDNYRYFFTDALFEKSQGIPIVPPILSFTAFGGGLYTRMQQASKLPQPVANLDPEFGKSLSGITYVPDRNVGLGMMATTKFGLTNASKTINAKVGFQIQFNNHGGLNFVQLRGDVNVMDTPDKWGKLVDNVQDDMKKKEAKGITQPSRAERQELGVPESKNNGFLTASILMEYDAINQVFSADMRSYLNAGIIKGRDANDMMGWASAYFAPDKWYIRAGTPANRMGIKVLNLADLNGYFMLGNDIPGLPPPPEKVLRNFSPDKVERLQRKSSNQLTFGKGIAFGAGMEVDINAKLTPFYAHIGAGVGSEFLLADLGGRTCVEYPGTPGINGWYAQAQAWAYAEADIGIEVKLFFKRYKLPILDVSAGALLKGSGPNPFYFAGTVGGRFSVLGGLVSGHCNFGFEIGQLCTLVGGSPFDEDVIAELTPGGDLTDVNVFTAPQAVFNIPVNKEMEIDEEDGARGIYMATLEEFRVNYKDNGQVAAGTTQYGNDSKVYMLKPGEPFESRKDVEVYAKVGFKKKTGEKWSYVTGADGKPVYEEKTESFTTGERPKEILPEHVKYSYPVSGQYNFYPNEHKGGYLFITENYAYLFTTDKPEGFKQMLRIEDIDGQRTDRPFTHRAGTTSGIRFEIDFAMDEVPFVNDKIYKLAIVNVPEQVNADAGSNVTTVTSDLEGADDVQVNRQKAEGALVQLNEKEIYALHFRSSSYNTFVEKMNAMSLRPSGLWQEYPFVYNIISNVSDYATPAEMFDIAEIEVHDTLQRLIVVTPLYQQTKWYTGQVGPLMYNAALLRDAGMEGMQLTTANVSNYVTKTACISVSDDMVNTNTRPYISPGGSLQYRATYYVDRDYSKLKNILANKVMTQGAVSEAAEALLQTDNIPLLENGTYPVKISYTLPGTRQVTSSVEKVLTINQ